MPSLVVLFHGLVVAVVGGDSEQFTVLFGTQRKWGDEGFVEASPGGAVISAFGSSSSSSLSVCSATGNVMVFVVLVLRSL